MTYSEHGLTSPRANICLISPKNPGDSFECQQNDPFWGAVLFLSCMWIVLWSLEGTLRFLKPFPHHRENTQQPFLGRYISLEHFLQCYEKDVSFLPQFSTDFFQNQKFLSFRNLLQIPVLNYLCYIQNKLLVQRFQLYCL